MVTACPSAPVPPVTTATRLVIGAGPARPAWIEGGLRKARPGSVVTGSVRPAWIEGGLRKARPGSVVTGSVRPAWIEGGLRKVRPGSVASSLGGRGHDRGALDLVVADFAHVELVEVVLQLLEGLLERRKRLARAGERGRAREEVVLHVGMVDPPLLDLRDGDAECLVGGADQVGALRPRVESLGQGLLEELVDPAQDRRERAAREPLVFLVEEAERDEVRRLELRGPRLFRGVRLFGHERPVHPDDLERLLLEVVGLLDVEREHLEEHLRLDDQDDRNEVGFQLVEDGAAMVAVRRPVDSGPGRDRDDRVHETVEPLDRFGEPLHVSRRKVALVGARLALRAREKAEDLPVVADGLLVERQDLAAISLDLRGELLRRLRRLFVSHRCLACVVVTVAQALRSFSRGRVDPAQEHHPLLTLPRPDGARRIGTLDPERRREQSAYFALGHRKGRAGGATPQRKEAGQQPAARPEDRAHRPHVLRAPSGIDGAEARVLPDAVERARVVAGEREDVALDELGGTLSVVASSRAAV